MAPLVHTEDIFGTYTSLAASGWTGLAQIQVGYPLSGPLGSRSVPDFGIFSILPYLHKYLQQGFTQHHHHACERQGLRPPPVSQLIQPVLLQSACWTCCLQSTMPAQISKAGWLGYHVPLHCMIKSISNYSAEPAQISNLTSWKTCIL